MGVTKGPKKTPIVHAGFMPLVDCAPLVIAKELGFAERNGVSLELHKEVSWANIRDKIIVGQFDCAHMLAPMPIAVSLGLNHVRRAVITPLTISLNGNAITVSKSLQAHMRDVASQISDAGPGTSAQALAAVVRERRHKNLKPLTFGVVFPYSCQNYELRDWLLQSGINVDHDVRIIGLPPSMMVGSLQADQIDGFCAGEPWNSAAVAAKVGTIVTTKEEQWGRAPEKVLGVRLDWAEAETDAFYVVGRAIYDAMGWLSNPANADHAAEVLSDDAYVAIEKDLIIKSIASRMVHAAGKPERVSPAFLKFPQGAESCPSRAHMSWIMHMMGQSRQLKGPLERAYIVDDVARGDLWAAITGLDSRDSMNMDRAIAKAKGLDASDPREILAELASRA